MSLRGSTTAKERIFACLPYLLPLIEGLIYFSDNLFNQFPELRSVFAPLLALKEIYINIPFAGIIVFFALFLLVVRNESIAHFIRFNTMQAILIDIILILCQLAIQILGNSFAAEILSNTVFIGVVAAVGYSVIQSALGRYAEVPVISEAVYMQVR